MLQCLKLEQGKIETISDYNPVDLFSSRKERVRKQLQNLVRNPQNNFKVVDCNGEKIESNEKMNEIFGKLIGNNSESTNNSTSGEAVLDVLVDIIQREKVFRTILKAQCWAAGKTATYANEALEILENSSNKSSSKNFEPTIADYEKALNSGLRGNWVDDESGMRISERDGEKLLERAKREVWRHDVKFNRSHEDLTEQLKGYLCRFLIGRMAMDLSISINLIAVDSESSGGNAIGSDLRKKLNTEGWNRISGSFGGGSLYYRVVLMDTDAKPVDRVPDYATQLEEYARAYARRSNKGMLPVNLSASGGRGVSSNFK